MNELMDVVVIGGGAAGMMAAGMAALQGARVMLLEKNSIPGKKILITGKGRCNVTNDCDSQEFQENMPGNGRFLFSAFSRYDSQFVHEFFEKRGVPLKMERGRRVFPVSDLAEDIRSSLESFARSNGVLIKTLCPVQKIALISDKLWQAWSGCGTFQSKAVVLATGGVSYPSTGSTGDGHRIAENLGHPLIPLLPSLVPLESDEGWVPSLQGLTLKNVAVSAYQSNGTVLGEEFGELLFTHFGVSGPTVLTLSRAIVLSLASGEGPVTIRINLKPALTQEELDDRLQREFTLNARRQYKNTWKNLLPRLLIPVIIELSKINPELPVHQISREERHGLVHLLQNLTLTVSNSRSLAEAVVTMGGVDVRKVQPSTMASRLHTGLYFCGELLDIDGYTGGYNLQAAFATGAVAGIAAADYAIGCQ